MVDRYLWTKFDVNPIEGFGENMFHEWSSDGRWITGRPNDFNNFADKVTFAIVRLNFFAW